MALQRFYIGPFGSGLQTNARPFLIMDDAFQTLQNVHPWRGRIINRFGALPINTAVPLAQQQLYTRLNLLVGTTNGSGNLTVNPVPGTMGTTPRPWNIGQIFSCGTEIYTSIALGTPAAMLSTGNGTATYDTTNGIFTLTGGPATTPVYFFPALPVMAIPTYEVNSLSSNQTFAFDTAFCYYLANAAAGWTQVGNAVTGPNPGIWTGTDSNFFSTANYVNPLSQSFLFFVVNYHPRDQIQYWDGTAGAWTQFTPQVDSAFNTDVLLTAMFCIVYKRRLIMFNTIENVGAMATQTTFVDRIRWSSLLDASSSAANSWNVNTSTAGFRDLGTRENIIGASLVKDYVVIKTETSTWSMVYTGNLAAPFQFQRIDNQLGVESFNSIINLDKADYGFGATGIHTCDAMHVERVDQQIPDTIFDIYNANSGPQRTAGVRDYYTEELYWSYNSADLITPTANVYPNQVLVYNYRTGGWSSNDDSITAFGYWQVDTSSALTWAEIDWEWQEWDQPWNDAQDEALFKKVIAGNQEGFTFLLEREYPQNSMSLQITNIGINGNLLNLTVMNHNSRVGDVIFIQNIVATGVGQTLTSINNNNYVILSVTDANTIVIGYAGAVVTGTYAGGGTIQRVSKISIVSKQYNLFSSVGKQMRIPKIDFYVDSTGTGEINFDYSTSTSGQLLQNGANNNGAAYGTNVLITSAQNPYEATQLQLWRSLFPSAEGEVIQFQLEYSQDEMLNPNIVFSQFQLHAIVLHAEQTQDFQQGW